MQNQDFLTNCNNCLNSHSSAQAGSHEDPDKIRTFAVMTSSERDALGVKREKVSKGKSKKEVQEQDDLPKKTKLSGRKQASPVLDDDDSIDNEIALLERQLQEMKGGSEQHGEDDNESHQVSISSRTEAKWNCLKGTQRFADLKTTMSDWRPPDFEGGMAAPLSFVPLVKDRRRPGHSSPAATPDTTESSRSLVSTSSSSSAHSATTTPTGSVVKRGPSISSSATECCGEFVRPDEFVGAGWKNTPGFKPLRQERRRPQSYQKKEDVDSEMSFDALVSARDQGKVSSNSDSKLTEDSFDTSLNLDQVLIDPAQPQDSCSSSFRSSGNNNSSRNNDDSFFSARSSLEESAKGGQFSSSFARPDKEEDGARGENSHNESFSNSFQSAQSHNSCDSSSGVRRSSKVRMTPRMSFSKPAASSSSSAAPSVTGRPDEFVGADNWAKTPGFTPMKKERRAKKKEEVTGLSLSALVGGRDKETEKTCCKNNAAECTIEPGVTSRMAFGGTTDGELVFVLKGKPTESSSTPRSLSSKQSPAKSILKSGSDQMDPATPRRSGSTGVQMPESPFQMTPTFSPTFSAENNNNEEEEKNEKTVKKVLKKRVEKRTKAPKLIKASKNDFQRLTNFLAQQEAEREDKNTVDTNVAHIMDDGGPSSLPLPDIDEDGKPAWASRKLRTTAKGQLLKKGVCNLANPITPKRMPVRLGG